MTQNGGAIRLDIGIFAHNEAQTLPRLLAELTRQSLFDAEGIDLRVLVLANGCTDGTAAAAEAARAALPEAMGARIVIHDFPQGGKSRTVTRFLRDCARPEADLVGFMDADILLPAPDTLERMAAALIARPELQVFVSRPVKDVTHFKLDVGPVARLIASAGDGLTDFRRSICGQLYMMRAGLARRMALPAGLPVEDGFVRAMVLTDLFTGPEDFTRIDGDPAVFHVYESIRGVGELLHHQTRLVVGSAINAALYGYFNREGLRGEALGAVLRGPAQEEGWLPARLDAELPRRPYGYVPFSFATNRLTRFRRQGARGLKPLVIALAGTGLDGLVYLRASLRMWRGRGAGFW
ncbi:glycosyltransferase family 2 protein [Poseidonocella sedimentorum]|uniref:Glycosyl transferase family 2 n=1 Tax=Poseidonocella sedimentorum TaxID=871652 RepID=A0A1I6ENR0_9RHOB|nr:glycosyltransferase [Poseidonocella sedimentorum]SFR19360.1 Glycosyl transferase family 2 [Poseidonocella sedimentorum]